MRNLYPIPSSSKVSCAISLFKKILRFVIALPELLKKKTRKDGDSAETQDSSDIRRKKTEKSKVSFSLDISFLKFHYDHQKAESTSSEPKE